MEMYVATEAVRPPEGLLTKKKYYPEDAVRKALFKLINEPARGERTRDLDSYVLQHFALIWFDILSEEGRSAVEFEMGDRLTIDHLKVLFNPERLNQMGSLALDDFEKHGSKLHYSHTSCHNCWASAVGNVLIVQFRKPGSEVGAIDEGFEPVVV